MDFFSAALAAGAKSILNAATTGYTVYKLKKRYDNTVKADKFAREHFGFVRVPDHAYRGVSKRIKEREKSNPPALELWNHDFANPRVIQVIRQRPLKRAKYHFRRNINKVGLSG